jgi:hypothetical protein
VFELCEELLDRVQVGGVFGQEEQLGAGGANSAADGTLKWTPNLGPVD